MGGPGGTACPGAMGGPGGTACAGGGVGPGGSTGCPGGGVGHGGAGCPGAATVWSAGGWAGVPQMAHPAAVTAGLPQVGQAVVMTHSAASGRNGGRPRRR